MIGRRFSRNVETDEADMRGFDAFDFIVVVVRSRWVGFDTETV